jgi:hypothetical protein
MREVFNNLTVNNKPEYSTIAERMRSQTSAVAGPAAKTAEEGEAAPGLPSSCLSSSTLHLLSLAALSILLHHPRYK